MKFGKNLSRNQVPEWAAHYIDYKGLKKLVKSTAAASETEQADTAGMCSPHFPADMHIPPSG